MDWEQVRQQLETIWANKLAIHRMALHEWNEEGAAAASSAGIPVRSKIKEGGTEFLAHKEGAEAVILTISEPELTAAERRLIEMMLGSGQPQDKKRSAASEEERRALLVSEWLHQQQEVGAVQAEMPDALISQLSLYSSKIPFLLYGDYSTSRRVQYGDLKKLLETFFDTETTLIPLTDKEWVILASEKILSMDAAEERDGDDAESREEQLAAIGYGLHGMLESEWVGESHLAVHYPMMPAKSLYSSVLQLRETIMLGRTYHVGSNMHLPWLLQLEKLIHFIPETEKAGFLERVLKRLDVALDAEMTTTLEQFFQLDCNVSETAKKLYIHRNTLLYRLDKFKQETGLDVRTFNDAVLVKIAMLLYKVTKRK